MTREDGRKDLSFFVFHLRTQRTILEFWLAKGYMLKQFEAIEKYVV